MSASFQLKTDPEIVAENGDPMGVSGLISVANNSSYLRDYKMVWFIPETLGGFAVSGFLIVLFRRYGAGMTWLSAGVISVILATLFARQWKSVGQIETPLIAEIVTGAIPVLATALVATTLGRRHLRVALLAGTLVFLLAYVASALIGTFVLGDLIPL